MAVAFAATSATAQSNQTTTSQGPGSSVAASDLYGIGVRLGLYLQTLGMLLSCISILWQQKGAAAGAVKLATSSNMIAILVSWTILVRQNAISPVEGWLVLNLVAMLMIPAFVAVFNPYIGVEETVGVTALLVAITWTDIGCVWFWARLYRELPALGTSGRVWYFAPVSITGWFRLFMLVVYSWNTFGLSAIFILLYGLVYALRRKIKVDLSIPPEEALGWRITVLVCFLYWCINWIVGIAASEEIIKLNGLSPQTNLATPGQSIPLVLGVTTLLDGMFTALRLCIEGIEACVDELFVDEMWLDLSLFA